MKHSLVLIVLLNATLVSGTESHQRFSWKTSALQQGISAVMHKYATSIITGSLVGLSVGGTCAFVDSKTTMFVSPASWYVSYRTRQALIESILDSLDEEKVKHDKEVVRDTAWLTSWIGWFLLMRLK